jgi:hypothetical protein
VGGCGRLWTLGSAPQQDAQLLHDRLNAARVHPAAHLLVDERPRRQIMRHQPPVRATLDDVAHAIEDLAQRVLLKTSRNAYF